MLKKRKRTPPSAESEARRLAASKAGLNRPEVKLRLSENAKKRKFGNYIRTAQIREKLRHAAAQLSPEFKAQRLAKSIAARQTPEHSAIRAALMYGNDYGKANSGRVLGPRVSVRFISGYKFIHVPGDLGTVGRRPGRWVAEHIFVAEAALGRFLAKGELIHHIDGNKINNAAANLFVASGHREHRLCHASLEAVAFELVRMGVIQFFNGRYILAECREQP